MRRALLLLAIVFIAVALFMAWFVPAAWLNKPTTDATARQVVIGEGTDIDSVSELLRNEGIINSAYGYRIYGMFDKSAYKPKAGTYPLKPGMSYRTIARIIALGPTRQEIEIKFIEGWTSCMMGSVIAPQGVTTADWVVQVGDALSGKPMDPSWRQDFGFLKALPANASLEGYLFPDTYRVWKDQLPQGLITKQLQTFDEQAQKIVDEANKQNRSLQDVVILASIVEREVAKPEDRKIVAGIFMNRLEHGMPLQSDATITYITGSGRARSNLDELDIVSPYNTYRNKGLPPAPICNPGADALDAALHPTATDYVYFLTDDKGKTYYAKTLEEHKRNRSQAFGE